MGGRAKWRDADETPSRFIILRYLGGGNGAPPTIWIGICGGSSPSHPPTWFQPQLSTRTRYQDLTLSDQECPRRFLHWLAATDSGALKEKLRDLVYIFVRKTIHSTRILLTGKFGCQNLTLFSATAHTPVKRTASSGCSWHWLSWS